MFDGNRLTGNMTPESVSVYWGINGVVGHGRWGHDSSLDGTIGGCLNKDEKTTLFYCSAIAT
jgi:hypothetical protein